MSATQLEPFLPATPCSPSNRVDVLREMTTALVSLNFVPFVLGLAPKYPLGCRITEREGELDENETEGHHQKKKFVCNFSLSESSHRFAVGPIGLD